MKRILLLAILLTFQISGYSQTVSVTGTVFDSETGKVIQGATAKIGNDSVITGADGRFELKNIAEGNAEITIAFSGYEPQTSSAGITAPETRLGAFVLKPVSFYNSYDAGISDATLSSVDFEDDNKEQNISGLLHSSTDVFNNTAGYSFSPAYFRIRGYDSENSNVYISGIMVNDPESGRPSWSEWGGLNDAMRNKEVVTGLDAARFSFGSVGGATNIITRASMQRKQQKLSYALSNKSYNLRLMYTYSTGLMKNDWAFTFSGSRRIATEGYVEGTFCDAWSYFAAAEKRINDKHSLAFTVYGSPTKRGMQAAATQEVYDLTGNNYYNPNWGLQNGEKRNAKVKIFHEPMAVFNHFWKANKKTTITNSLGYSFGKTGKTSLNWFNAPDPRPDYYRNLPGWQTNQDLTVTPDSALVGIITDNWKNDINTRQINWDKLYQINNLANITNSPTNYILEERRDDHSQISFNSVLNYQKSDKILFSGGLELSKYTGSHFKIMKDLLGGNNWIDIDQFAVQDYPGSADSIQNDLNNPNRIINVGDRFGYDYNIYENYGQLWAQTEFSYNRLGFFVAANASGTQFRRKGNMKNGRNPDNSFGDSEKKSFFNFGLKGGVTYKINGHNYFIGNAGYFSRAPYSRNAFVSPDIKNTLVADLASEEIASGDISYIYKTQKVNVRISAYQTMFKNSSKVISFYHDDYKTFVNMTMTGIDKTMQGFELGAEIKASGTVSLVAVGALGNYIYTSRPAATISLENGSAPDKTETIYQKYFFLSGTPQNAASAGIKYAHPKFWYFNANLNYFDKMYLDFNPERRTQEAVYMLGEGNALIDSITRQQKLDGGFTLDVSLGKSLRVKNYFVNINFSISNLLNNQSLITNGYEQMRFDFNDSDYKNINKFPPKYFYSFGRTYYLLVSVRI